MEIVFATIGRGKGRGSDTERRHLGTALPSKGQWISGRPQDRPHTSGSALNHTEDGAVPQPTSHANHLALCTRVLCTM